MLLPTTQVFALAHYVPADVGHGGDAPRRPATRELLKTLRSRPLAMFLGEMFIFGMAVGIVERLLFVYVVDVLGGSSLLCGWVVFVSSMTNIPVFQNSALLLKHIGREGLMIVAYACYFVRVFGYTRSRGAGRKRASRRGRGVIRAALDLERPRASGGSHRVAAARSGRVRVESATSRRTVDACRATSKAKRAGTCGPRRGGGSSRSRRSTAARSRRSGSRPSPRGTQPPGRAEPEFRQNLDESCRTAPDPRCAQSKRISKAP